MWSFTTNPLLADFLPSYSSTDAYQKLKSSIRTHGKCFSKFIVWRNPLASHGATAENILVDGHNRLKAIEELRAEGFQIADPEIELLDFSSFGEVKQWMMNHADATRPNWTDLEKVKRLEEDVELNAFLKSEAQNRQRAGKKATPKAEEGKKSRRDGEVVTTKARMAGMGQDKYRKAMLVLRNPEARKLVEQGKLTINKAIFDVEVATKKVAQNKVIFENQKSLPDWTNKNAQLNSVINCDTLLGIPLPDNSIDLIFTSPPYAVRNSKVRYVQPFFTGRYSDYLGKLETSFKEFYRVIAAGGYFVLNIDNCSPSPDDANDGMTFYNCYADSCRIAEQCGFKTMDVVLWYKQKTISNQRVMMGSKDNPRIQRNFEYVIVFRKLDALNAPKPHRIEDLSTADFHLYTMGHWDITPDAPGRKDHVCPFPLELAERVVKLYSPRLGVVLDPFAGRGTTCEAAVLNGRQYVGCEINQVYCETAEKRVAAAIETVNTQKRTPPPKSVSDADITKQIRKNLSWGSKRNRMRILQAQK